MRSEKLARVKIQIPADDQAPFPLKEDLAVIEQTRAAMSRQRRMGEHVNGFINHERSRRQSHSATCSLLSFRPITGRHLPFDLDLVELEGNEKPVRLDIRCYPEQFNPFSRVVNLSLRARLELPLELDY